MNICSQGLIRKYASAASGPVALTVVGPERKWALVHVRLHFVGGNSANEALTGTVDSHLGANFDAEVVNENMNGMSCISVSPGEPLSPLDEIDFAHANTNNLAWGLEVFYEEAS